MPGTWTTLIGDLRERKVRRAALTGVQAVVHAAALHAPHVSVACEVEFRSVNVELTAALLAEAVTRGDLYRDAAEVIRRRAPAAAAAFTQMGWPLPSRIDRVYDSRAAAAALGYQPAGDVVALLSPHLPFQAGPGHH